LAAFLISVQEVELPRQSSFPLLGPRHLLGRAPRQSFQRHLLRLLLILDVVLEAGAPGLVSFGGEGHFEGRPVQGQLLVEVEDVFVALAHCPGEFAVLEVYRVSVGNILATLCSIFKTSRRIEPSSKTKSTETEK
jgi:hypothetical protein